MIAPVSNYALASRLSYFLWSSMPDDELFTLAARKQLSDPKVLTAQVDRMLKDRRSDAFVEGFFGQWLGLRKVLDVTVDPKLFPEFSTELKEDLRRETTLFVESIVRENRSALDLLTAEDTFLNGRLAKFYGIPGQGKSEDFKKVSLAGTSRQGVLTHGSILMLTSYPNRTSPTRRGNWILETILGEEPPPPPDNVPELAQTQATSPDLPLRKQLELHRVNATCVSCHRTMDAIGFGFENFDAIGRWRDRDRGQPIDAAGDLPSGDKFNSPKELIRILSQRQDDFARHLTSRLLTYALGRGVEYYDRPAIDGIVEQTRADRFRFQDLLREVVLSRPFLWQRDEREETRP